MNKNDSLGNRMKQYEGISRNFLTRRVPAIIRIDGKAFHTFTKGMRKPFDRILMSAMQQTMKYLCENIQGCVFGYTQSDEITLVLTDYEKITTDAWFGYNVQKMTSVSASMATLAFNNAFARIVNDEYNKIIYSEQKTPEMEEYLKFFDNYFKKINTALFDSRAFTVPREEVCNCLIWRQQDATRNSIESVGQANFSHKELMNKSCSAIQDMLWEERGINWNDFPTDSKRGSCCYRVPTETTVVNSKTNEEILVIRNLWTVDTEIPILTQDREFIERLL